jgi:hypothetical protein
MRNPTIPNSGSASNRASAKDSYLGKSSMKNAIPLFVLAGFLLAGLLLLTAFADETEK